MIILILSLFRLSNLFNLWFSFLLYCTFLAVWISRAFDFLFGNRMKQFWVLLFWQFLACFNRWLSKWLFFRTSFYILLFNFWIFLLNLSRFYQGWWCQVIFSEDVSHRLRPDKFCNTTRLVRFGTWFICIPFGNILNWFISFHIQGCFTILDIAFVSNTMKLLRSIGNSAYTLSRQSIIWLFIIFLRSIALNLFAQINTSTFIFIFFIIYQLVSFTFS